MRVNHAKCRIAAIADINDAVTDADCRWPECDPSSAQLDLSCLKPSHLRNSVGCLIDYIHAPGIARRHPQFSYRAIVCKIVQRYDAGCAGQRQWLELIIRVGRATAPYCAYCPKGMKQRDGAELCKVQAPN